MKSIKYITIGVFVIAVLSIVGYFVLNSISKKDNEVEKTNNNNTSQNNSENDDIQDTDDNIVEENEEDNNYENNEGESTDGQDNEIPEVDTNDEQDVTYEFSNTGSGDIKIKTYNYLIENSTLKFTYTFEKNDSSSNIGYNSSMSDNVVTLNFTNVTYDPIPRWITNSNTDGKCIKTLSDKWGNISDCKNENNTSMYKFTLYDKREYKISLTDTTLTVEIY